MECIRNGTLNKYEPHLYSVGIDLPVTQACHCPTKHMQPETILINVAQLKCNQAIEMGLGIGKKSGTRNARSIEEISDDRFKTKHVVGQCCM